MTFDARNRTVHLHTHHLLLNAYNNQNKDQDSDLKIARTVRETRREPVLSVPPPLFRGPGENGPILDLRLGILVDYYRDFKGGRGRRRVKRLHPYSVVYGETENTSIYCSYGGGGGDGRSWAYMCIYIYLCWNKIEHRNSRDSCVPKGVDDTGERGPFFLIFIVEKEWLRVNWGASQARFFSPPFPLSLFLTTNPTSLWQVLLVKDFWLS
jgi:hypothetical protein